MDWDIFKKLVERKVDNAAIHTSYGHLVELSSKINGNIEENLHKLGIIRGNEIKENILSENVEDTIINLWISLFNYRPTINRNGNDLLIIDNRCPLCTNISVDFHYCSFIAGIVEAVIDKKCFEEKCKALGEEECIYRVKNIV